MLPPLSPGDPDKTISSLPNKLFYMGAAVFREDL